MCQSMPHPCVLCRKLAPKNQTPDLRSTKEVFESQMLEISMSQRETKKNENAKTLQSPISFHWLFCWGFHNYNSYKSLEDQG